jgi:hypothetical protein
MQKWTTEMFIDFNSDCYFSAESNVKIKQLHCHCVYIQRILLIRPGAKRDQISICSFFNSSAALVGGLRVILLGEIVHEDPSGSE